MTPTIVEKIHRISLWLIPIIVLLVSPVHGQVGGANPLVVKHRNNCRLAAQVLTTGQPNTKRDWAREYIGRCENEGPPAIAQEWRNVASDTADVVELMRASTRIRDARIYEAARAVVLDRSRSDVVRVGAMHVLDQYANPLHSGWFVSVQPPVGPIRRIHAASGSVSHTAVARGPVPLHGSVREPVLRLFEDVAAAREMEPLPVWYAAAALAKRMGSRQ